MAFPGATATTTRSGSAVDRVQRGICSFCPPQFSLTSHPGLLFPTGLRARHREWRAFSFSRSAVQAATGPNQRIYAFATRGSDPKGDFGAMTNANRLGIFPSIRLPLARLAGLALLLLMLGDVSDRSHRSNAGLSWLAISIGCGDSHRQRQCGVFRSVRGSCAIHEDINAKASIGVCGWNRREPRR